MAEDKIKNLINLCKSRGFVYQGSEIYGGLANTWDYGPLGVELKNNIKREWWNYFVQKRDDMVGIDTGILMNPKIWEVSGHVSSFADPLIDCKSCKNRYRADDLIKTKLKVDLDGKSISEINQFLEGKKLNCPNCGNSNFTEVRSYNLMFRTSIGAVEGKTSDIYLRPETAQGIFINFKNVVRTSRKKLPFGIAQIGKSFRNEITPGNFIFRILEFEQMEIEYFVTPGKELEFFDKWLNDCRQWFKSLGLKDENLRIYDHPKEKLSHYSNKTVDFEYNFPFGWSELIGIASRTDFDLKKHSENSIETLDYTDPDTNEKYIPYVIEPSFGVDRLFLTFMLDAYEVEQLEKDKRNVLKLNYKLAPIKIAVLPLARNVDEIVNQSRQIYDTLRKNYNTLYDDTGSIGKLYRRQDEIGTPFCITIDHKSVDEDKKVTVRNRDTMLQERIDIAQLETYFADQFK